MEDLSEVIDIARGKDVDILHPLASLESEECEEMPVYLGGGRDLSKADRMLYISSDLESWSEFPTPSYCFTLSTYDSQLVIVGGKEEGEVTNKLWTSVDGIKWESSLPPMPTKRISPSVLSSESQKCLIVTGGYLEGVQAYSLRELDVVEVFVEEQWSKVPSLPLYKANSKATLHDSQVFILSPSSNVVSHCTVESLLSATKCESQSTSLWSQFKSPSNITTLASFGHQLIAAGGHTKIYAYSSSTRSWVHVQDLEIPYLESYSYSVSFLSTREFLLHLTSDFFESTVKVSLVAYSFDREDIIQCTTLHRLEAMGIPIVTALREVHSKLKTVVGIDMTLADHSLDDEPWESLIRKWELDQDELNERIENFLGDFKSLQERCMSVIVSALVEQRSPDPEELCSQLPDYVLTIFRYDITNAVEMKWIPPSSGSPSPSVSPLHTKQSPPSTSGPLRESSPPPSGALREPSPPPSGALREPSPTPSGALMDSSPPPLRELSPPPSGPLKKASPPPSGPIREASPPPSGPLGELPPPPSGPLREASPPPRGPLREASLPPSGSLREASPPLSGSLGESSLPGGSSSPSEHPPPSKRIKD